MGNQKQVSLCVTCLVDQWMPEIGVASVRLLRAADCEVEFPSQQTCCGQPFFNSGFNKEAANLARRTIEIFEPFEYIVLPSGSCTSMIRVEYPHLLSDSEEWHQRAVNLAGKTFELTEFLVKVLDWQPARVEDAPAVTYHDSCHMYRLLHLGKEPRQLLEAVGSSMTEMAESDRCCGFGGIFSIRMPEVSNAMTKAKLKEANETGTGLLVTADPGCLMQIRGNLSSADLQVVHIATLLKDLSE